MPLIQIASTEIAELGTPVAIHGAMRAGEAATDDIFDIIVGIVLIVAEM